jgi:hypothetical protein
MEEETQIDLKIYPSLPGGGEPEHTTQWQILG